MSEYDLSVVLMSYAVAVMAAFTALEMAGKVMRPDHGILGWLSAGSIAMGTGIWSMHFIGMEAYRMPFEVTYDATLTVLSWVAAVGVSALALATLSLIRRSPERPDPKIVIPAGLLMGAGICIMHYSGMAAMRLSPAIVWDPVLIAASVLIAIAASVATLLIAVRLRTVRRFSDLLLRFGAAMVMGLAIAGMHYTGMFAATFAPDTVCIATGGLSGGWTIGPVTFATIAIILAALVLSLSETQAIRARRRAEREMTLRAAHKAFTDLETDLPNRSWLNRQLADGLGAGQERVTLILVEARQFLKADDRREFANWLRRALPESQPIRLQGESFGLLFYNQDEPSARRRVHAALEQSLNYSADEWALGAASFPDGTEQLFRLVPRARADLEAVAG
ncbi:MAG: MHYT domain-containing protein [Wenzhouxiangella sp.]